MPGGLGPSLQWSRMEMETKLKASEILKVIIIDDFHVIVERLRKIVLALPGVTISGTTDNTVSAWKMIEAEQPSVLIMDIHLKNAEPKKGIAFLSEVKKLFPEISVIVFTNCADTRYEDLCLSHGADFFFDKATDSNQISVALLGIVERYANSLS
jgi:DNA-binding NarL/FixJ family response regulator